MSTGKVVVKIKTAEDLLLTEFSTDAKMGINYLDYDLKINEEIIKDYELFLNKIKDKKEGEIKLEKAGNGDYYIYKGAYTVEIEVNGKSSSSKLIIK